MDFAGSYKLKKPMATSTQASYSSDSNLTDLAVGACVSELMNAVTTFHKLHLKITGEGSYSVHKALNELYETLPDMVDSIAEGYQGATEKLLKCTENSPKSLYSKEEAVSYIRELSSMITELQGKVPYSEVVNDLDNVKSALNSAKYKLLFLQ
jgi:DNA-binding ferritin-like protein